MVRNRQMMQSIDLCFFVNSMVPYMESNRDFATGQIKDKMEELEMWDVLATQVENDANQPKIESLRMLWYRRVDWALTSNQTSALSSRIVRIFSNCPVYEPIFLKELSLPPIINKRLQVKQEFAHKRAIKHDRSSDSSEVDTDSDDDKKKKRQRSARKSCPSSTSGPEYNRSRGECKPITEESAIAFNSSLPSYFRRTRSPQLSPPFASFANPISTQALNRSRMNIQNPVALAPAASSTPVASPAAPVASIAPIAAIAPTSSTPQPTASSSVADTNLDMGMKFHEFQQWVQKTLKDELKQNRELMEMKVLEVEDRMRQEHIRTATCIQRMFERIMQGSNTIQLSLDDIKGMIGYKQLTDNYR